MPPAAITAGCRRVTASVASRTQVEVGFTSRADASFRVVVASPGWTGGDAALTATDLIGGTTTPPSAP